MEVLAVPGGEPLEQARHLAVGVGWGRWSGEGPVMPGTGRIVAREALALLGPGTLDIYLNELACWRNVLANIWRFTVGGYQVLRKWLSYREEGVLGRPLTQDEVSEVTAICRRAAAVLLLQAGLDRNYDEVVAAPYDWHAGRTPAEVVWRGPRRVVSDRQAGRAAHVPERRGAPAGHPGGSGTLHGLAGASRQLVEHLADPASHGCRRVIAILSSSSRSFRAREDGYRDAMGSHGLEPDVRGTSAAGGDEPIGDVTTREAEAIAGALLDERPMPDALFGGNNRVTEGILRAFAARDMEPGRETKLVSFDLPHYFDGTGSLRLTAAVQHPDRIGQAAAEVLVRLIEGRPAREDTIVGTDIVWGTSYGCRRGADAMRHQGQVPDPADDHAYGGRAHPADGIGR